MLPYSARQRTSSAAPTPSTARADRSPSPISANRMRCATPSSQPPSRASFPRNDDFNGARQEGAGYFQTTSRRGRRCSAAVGYLRPARKRDNLRVLTEAPTLSVLIEAGVAAGVAFSHQGETWRADAVGEVILAAGAIATPPTLQLSGIGPGAELLRRHGIAVVRDLPGVGENLQDHLQSRLVYRCTRPITLNDDIASPVRSLGIGLRYALWRKGPLAVSAGYAGGIIRTDPRLATPDVQAHFINFSTTKMGDTLHPFSGFTASICQLRPENRGFVRIKSADPTARPAIQLNYLAAETDRRTMVAGLKLLRRIMQAPALQPYIESEYEPGPACASDEVCCSIFARAPARSALIRPALAAWARMPRRWSMRGSGCTASGGCASSTARSCRAWCPATPTRRSS